MTDDLTVQYVLMALPRGRDNARSLSDLAESLHLLRRTVEHSVQALRLDGFPVCSDGSGIWLGDRADQTRCIASLQRRIVVQYLTLRAMRRSRDAAMGEQTTLPWTGEAA